MRNKVRKVLVVFLCIFGLTMVSSVSEAGPIETINLTTGPINYSAGEFTGPNYMINGDISFPKFDPSLGWIKRVKLTATILSAGMSTIEVESERETGTHTPIVSAGGWFGGEWNEIVDPIHGFHVVGDWTTAILAVDDEPGNPPDWYGDDYESFSAAVYSPISDISTINPDPWYPPEEPPNYNPAFHNYVHNPGTSANFEGYYSVYSCTHGYWSDLEARHTPGDVSVQLDVEYTYVVPEPATLLLLGLGGFALRRKRRAK